MMIELPRYGKEYAHFPFENLPTDVTPEVSFDGPDGPWTPLIKLEDEWVILLRGPDNASEDGVLIERGVDVYVRVVDSPEEVIRHAGIVRFTE